MEASRVEDIDQKLERIYVGDFWKLRKNISEAGEDDLGIETRKFEVGKSDMSQLIWKQGNGNKL